MRSRVSVALLSVTLVAAGITPLHAQPDETTATVELVSQKQQVLLEGTVIPARQVTIAARLLGRVGFIAGEEGDAFEQNTAIVALDDDELLAQRQAAMAQMAKADAALRDADVQFNRDRMSSSPRNFSDMAGNNDSGVERHADPYALSTGVVQARNAFLQARSQVLAIDAQLHETIGYAPFYGVIVRKMVEVGDTVQAGQPLIVYADTLMLQLQVEVPVRLMPGIYPGALVPVRLDMKEEQLLGKVSQIIPMADPVSHTVTVKLDLPVGAPAAPGMHAEVRIRDINMRGEQVPVPAVPRSALIQRGSLPSVCVLSSEGRKEIRVVRLGQPIDEKRTAVLAGLSGGEQVFIHPESEGCH